MPNVLLLMSDEHNPFFSSPYGHPTVQTPNMQRMAEEGVIFENAYCPSPLCMPSRTAMMTGRRVHEVRAYSNCNVNVSPEFLSYGRALTRQGVYAAHVGKLDVHDRGRNLGFSECLAPLERKLPGDINCRRRPLRIRQGAAERAGRFGPHAEPFTHDPLYMDAALEWLQKKAPNVPPPWALVVSLVKPHFPHYVTQELWDMYPDGEDLPARGADCESARHPYARDLRAHFETDRFTEEQVRGLRRGYLGCVTFVDQQLGRLLEALQNIGRLEDTNVIYTSDHGEMLGKFGMWWKCTLYEDTAHVPLLAMGPDFSGGRRVATPVDLHDVRAELFRSTGTEHPADWLGESLAEIPGNDSDRVVFSEYHGHGTRAAGYMIRKGDWKLVHCTEAPNQLFDLAADPDELNNLYDADPGKAQELEKELRTICSPENEDRRAHEFQTKQFETIEKKYGLTA